MNDEFKNAAAPLAKTATKLNLRKINKPDNIPITATYFGGQPYAENGDEYPVCPACRRPLAFICQIDLTKGFHEKPEGISLFSFFYCHECFPWGLSDDEKGSWLVRTYSDPGPEKFALITPPAEIEYPTGHCLASEEKITVYPNWEDFSGLLPEVPDSFIERSPEPWDEYDAAVKELGGFNDFATIIGGYPFWVQGSEMPECGVCGNEMDFLLQIDSEEKADLGWGDSGLVYFFYCKKHPGEIKFLLQCF
jgi:uncharacterized protein YwqG